ncbi:hypothetical protein SAMN04488588_1646 [Geotoga petraea]|jgi:hypothetical protein|uniref:Uncharacterized protein n=1 Tax=Geotoga petraea TaxID=28234 RepID=A0A1G6NS60_9BACT|nr:hypothetical protein SAMN04488588_1646 [Geotoga petraea]
MKVGEFMKILIIESEKSSNYEIRGCGTRKTQQTVIP